MAAKYLYDKRSKRKLAKVGASSLENIELVQDFIKELADSVVEAKYEADMRRKAEEEAEAKAKAEAERLRLEEEERLEQERLAKEREEAEKVDIL